ncbi:MAG TPA: hypothetical protein VMR98_03085, partial [Candidatus Polarisedimenticolaceae bacterium]|nr:hypothetical protein [Candidatus Polarisedimenticolaceae bacterium]
ERLEAKIAGAQAQVVCDIGFYFGTLGDNFAEFPKIIGKVKGLKVYLGATTGNFTVAKAKLRDIYKAWPGDKPILLHADDDASDAVRDALEATRKPTHICHVSSQAELELVIKAKEAGLPITCGVTPHHLFLTDEDAERLGDYGRMKPPLKSRADQDFLWSHLDAIDVIESDHAPHTRAEKDSGSPHFGVPGLETTLPLMLTAEAEGKLTRQQLTDRLYTNPARIFEIATDENTYVEVDMSEHEITSEGLHTKAGWTPFAGTRVIGKVARVILRGKTVYEEGKVLAAPGSGQMLS